MRVYPILCALLWGDEMYAEKEMGCMKEIATCLLLDIDVSIRIPCCYSKMISIRDKFGIKNTLESSLFPYF